MQPFDKLRNHKPEEISWADYSMVLLIFFSMISFIFIGILNLVSVYLSIFALLFGFNGPISDVGILGIISTALLTVIIVELYITVEELKNGFINIKLILIISLTATVRHFILLISQGFNEKYVLSTIGVSIVMLIFIIGLWIVKSKNIDNISHIWTPVKKPE